MNKLSIALFIIVSFAFATSMLGQLIEKPFATLSPSNHSQARILATGDTLSLPFFDDFSQSYYIADTNNWDVNYLDVLINSSIGIAPPSINVATFDGWDQFGTPHSGGQDTPSPYRSDSLISKPIDLSGLVEEDNILLTFYWQQEGLGDTPELEDKLILSFFTKDSVWQDVEFIIGDESNRNGMFQYTSIHISDSEYLHGGFKFKFVSLGNPDGPFDVWHVDYITLDKKTPRYVDDIAISTKVSSIFKGMTMVPIDQFFAYSEDIMETDSAYVSSFLNEFQTVNLTFRVLEQETNTIIDSHVFTSSNFEANLPLIKNGIPNINFDNFSPYESQDSLYLYSELIMSGFNGLSLIRPENDTSRAYFNLHETLAYDDGSAEYIAGINQSGGELAIFYSIPEADTVTAVDIYFPIVYPLPTPGTLSIRVLKDLTEKTDTTTLGQEFSITYADTINQFARFEFDEPIIVTEDFYISMKQFTNSYIPIGLDKNTDTAERIFFKTGNDWEQNSSNNVQGSLMFRAIFSNATIEEDTILTTKQLNINAITLYPNPAESYVQIDGQYDQYDMYDMLGGKVLSGNSHHIDLRKIKKGIYIFRFYTNDQVVMKRIVLQ